MKKKPAKVQEAVTPYVAKPAAKAAAPNVEGVRQIRYATPEQVRKATEKVFRVHAELFRKLAQ